jgi:excisionase family DNA binding protein
MEDFLTVKDLSRILHVSRVWVYKLVREKRIPFYHVEKCVRFSPSEISEWLESKKNREWHRDK